MKHRHIAGCIYVIGLLAVLIPSLSRAQGYEVELKAVADKLVSKLEAANQHSGTVLDFTDLQGDTTELGRFLAQELSDQLVAASKTMSFVDRANLQYLLRENKLSTEGFINPETSRKLGNLIGIDTTIFGTVTQIGDRTVRLSVRAVAVETGKIVAAQSANLPVTEGIAAMLTHGVATAPAATSSSGPPQATDVRARFRADSIKMSAGPAIVDVNMYGSEVGATFTVQNHSGIPIGIAVVTNSTTIGPCTNLRAFSGLRYFDDYQIQQIRSKPEPEKAMSYLPDNGKVTVTATFDRLFCRIRPNTTVDLSTSLIIAVGQEVFVMPASVSVVTR